MPEFLVRGDSPKIGRDVGTENENRKMITQALSYSPVDRASHPLPRTGKGGLRPVDFLHLIDAARLRWRPQAKRASLMLTATAEIPRYVAPRSQQGCT